MLYFEVYAYVFQGSQESPRKKFRTLVTGAKTGGGHTKTCLIVVYLFLFGFPIPTEPTDNLILHTIIATKSATHQRIKVTHIEIPDVYVLAPFTGWKQSLESSICFGGWTCTH